MPNRLHLSFKNDIGWVAFTHNSKLVHKNRFNLIVSFAYHDDVLRFCLLKCFHESHAKPTMRYPDSCHASVPSLCTVRHNDATSIEEASSHYLHKGTDSYASLRHEYSGPIGAPSPVTQRTKPRDLQPGASTSQPPHREDAAA